MIKQIYIYRYVLYTMTLAVCSVFATSNVPLILHIREPEIKLKCQWKFYIKGFLYMSLECPQFCMVRPFHTQTSRIAHTHTQPTHTHTTWKELWPCPSCPQYTSVFQSEISVLHKIRMVMDDEVKYPHSYFKILSVSVYFFFLFY